MTVARKALLATAAVIGAVLLAILGAFLVAEATAEGGTASAVCQATTPATLEVPRSEDPPVRYAPLVFLHPRETHLPLSAGCFVENSALFWARGKRAVPVAERGSVDAEKLGNGGYSVDVAGRSCEGEGCFTSTTLTRPYHPNRGVLRGRTGFYLDVENRLRGGSLSTSKGPIFSGTPVYYETGDGFITYWFFYGFSAAAARLESGGVKLVGHEGDWEQISVHLRDGEAVEVAYSQHGKRSVLPWPLVPKLGTHPIVYSARASHASYPTDGEQKKFQDVTALGRLWPTWELLVDVKEEPWHGFGGAWGVAGTPPLERGRTGPLGPSRYK